MGDIISYLKRQRDYKFSEEPFNEVDALILSQFIYLKLEDLIPSPSAKEKNAILYEIGNRMDYEKVFEDKRRAKNNKMLFKLMAESRRYRNMQLNYFSNITSITAETQFAALTCFLEEGPAVVVYRGTDESLVGWKEDFNMFFKKPVTGQNLSELYLQTVSGLMEGSFYLAGHSKGGNFAVYAAMNVPEQVQERIEKVYTFDNPGFRPEILESIDFNRIKAKILKFLPKSSFFGMFLESEEEYQVVDCIGKGVKQHNPYHWLVEGNLLKREKELDYASQMLNETFNEWLYQLEDEELYCFAEVWYQILRKANMTTVLDFMKDPAKNIVKLMGVIRDTEEETKECAKEIALVLMEMRKENREYKRKDVKNRLQKMIKNNEIKEAAILIKEKDTEK